MFSVPLYFQVTARASNTVAGAHVFPAAAGNAVGGMMSGWLIHRYARWSHQTPLSLHCLDRVGSPLVFVPRTGRYKGLIIFGTLASASSYLLLMLRWHGHTNWLESMYIIPG